MEVCASILPWTLFHPKNPNFRMNNETVLISRSFPFFSFLLLFSVCLCQLREHYASPRVKICNISLLILELLRRASVVAPHFSGRGDSASSFLHCATGWIAGISLFSHDSTARIYPFRRHNCYTGGVRVFQRISNLSCRVRSSSFLSIGAFCFNSYRGGFI